MDTGVVWARPQILDRHPLDHEWSVGELMRLLGGRPRMRTGSAFWFHSVVLVDGITFFISAIECLIRGRPVQPPAASNKVPHYYGCDELDPAGVDYPARQAGKSWREPSVPIGYAGRTRICQEA